MTKGTKLTLAILALVAAVAAGSVLAARTHASERAPLSRISNTGHHVAVQRGAVWRGFGLTGASLLGVRGTRAFYRLESKGGPCVGAGPADDPGKLGTVDCPRGPFPTSQRPVLDLSVYEGASHDSHDVSLYRAEGVAADGVASIGFLRPNGTIALRVPVNANVYEAGAIPNGPIAGLAAHDAAGRELWRSP
ncbi:MAG: hypothetical protein QOF27_2224 [Gaiellaceae bacterium]|nr:hypothetical protein [Gaiellaceae bacterium]